MENVRLSTNTCSDYSDDEISFGSNIASRSLGRLNEEVTVHSPIASHQPHSGIPLDVKQLNVTPKSEIRRSFEEKVQKSVSPRKLIFNKVTDVSSPADLPNREFEPTDCLPLLDIGYDDAPEPEGCQDNEDIVKIEECTSVKNNELPELSTKFCDDEDSESESAGSKDDEFVAFATPTTFATPTASANHAHNDSMSDLCGMIDGLGIDVTYNDSEFYSFSEDPVSSDQSFNVSENVKNEIKNLGNMLLYGVTAPENDDSLDHLEEFITLDVEPGANFCSHISYEEEKFLLGESPLKPLRSQDSQNMSNFEDIINKELELLDNENIRRFSQDIDIDDITHYFANKYNKDDDGENSQSIPLPHEMAPFDDDITLLQNVEEVDQSLVVPHELPLLTSPPLATTSMEVVKSSPDVFTNSPEYTEYIAQQQHETTPSTFSELNQATVVEFATGVDDVDVTSTSNTESNIPEPEANDVLMYECDVQNEQILESQNVSIVHDPDDQIPTMLDEPEEALEHIPRTLVEPENGTRCEERPLSPTTQSTDCMYPAELEDILDPIPITEECHETFSIDAVLALSQNSSQLPSTDAELNLEEADKAVVIDEYAVLDPVTPVDLPNQETECISETPGLQISEVKLDVEQEEQTIEDLVMEDLLNFSSKEETVPSQIMVETAHQEQEDNDVNSAGIPPELSQEYVPAQASDCLYHEDEMAETESSLKHESQIVDMDIVPNDLPMIPKPDAEFSSLGIEMSQLQLAKVEPDDESACLEVYTELVIQEQPSMESETAIFSGVLEDPATLTEHKVRSFIPSTKSELVESCSFIEDTHTPEASLNDEQHPMAGVEANDRCMIEPVVVNADIAICNDAPTGMNTDIRTLTDDKVQPFTPTTKSEHVESSSINEDVHTPEQNTELFTPEPITSEPVAIGNVDDYNCYQAPIETDNEICTPEPQIEHTENVNKAETPISTKPSSVSQKQPSLRKVRFELDVETEPPQEFQSKEVYATEESLHSENGQDVFTKSDSCISEIEKIDQTQESSTDLQSAFPPSLNDNIPAELTPMLMSESQDMGVVNEPDVQSQFRDVSVDVHADPVKDDTTAMTPDFKGSKPAHLEVYTKIDLNLGLDMLHTIDEDEPFITDDAIIPGKRIGNSADMKRPRESLGILSPSILKTIDSDDMFACKVFTPSAIYSEKDKQFLKSIYPAEAPRYKGRQLLKSPDLTTPSPISIPMKPRPSRLDILALPKNSTKLPKEPQRLYSPVPTPTSPKRKVPASPTPKRAAPPSPKPKLPASPKIKASPKPRAPSSPNPRVPSSPKFKVPSSPKSKVPSSPTPSSRYRASPKIVNSPSSSRYSTVMMPNRDVVLNDSPSVSYPSYRARINSPVPRSASTGEMKQPWLPPSPRPHLKNDSRHAPRSPMGTPKKSQSLERFCTPMKPDFERLTPLGTLPRRAAIMKNEVPQTPPRKPLIKAPVAPTPPRKPLIKAPVAPTPPRTMPPAMRSQSKAGTMMKPRAPMMKRSDLKDVITKTKQEIVNPVRGKLEGDVKLTGSKVVKEKRNVLGTLENTKMTAAHGKEERLRKTSDKTAATKSSAPTKSGIPCPKSRIPGGRSRIPTPRTRIPSKPS